MVLPAVWYDIQTLNWYNQLINQPPVELYDYIDEMVAIPQTYAQELPIAPS